MKSRLLLCVGLTSLTGLISQGFCHSAEPQMLPTDREVTEIAPTERNPYGASATVNLLTNVPKAVSEESRLRRIISLLKVGGVSGSGANARVLLGSLILKPGLELPPLLRDQFELLRVTEISAKEVHIAFLEREPAADPRSIIIALQAKPKVTQLLYGESLERLTDAGESGADLPTINSPAVLKFLEESMKAKLQNFTTPRVELMSAPQDAKPDP